MLHDLRYAGEDAAAKLSRVREALGKRADILVVSEPQAVSWLFNIRGSDVPHTKAIAVCTDQAVLGRTFYLMAFVDGWSPMGLETDAAGNRSWPEPFNSDISLRKDLGYQLVEGCALLSMVDWQAKGLQDLGRPDGFHDSRG